MKKIKTIDSFEIYLNADYEFIVKVEGDETFGARKASLQEAIDYVKAKTAAKARAEIRSLDLPIIDSKGRARRIKGVHRKTGELLVHDKLPDPPEKTCYVNRPWVRMLIGQVVDLKQQIRQIEGKLASARMYLSVYGHKDPEAHNQTLDSIERDYDRASDRADAFEADPANSALVEAAKGKDGKAA